MKNITKKALKEWLRLKLSTDKKWAHKALYRLYDFQTTTAQRKAVNYYYKYCDRFSRSHLVDAY